MKYLLVNPHGRCLCPLAIAFTPYSLYCSCVPLLNLEKKKILNPSCEHILSVCIYAHMCTPVELEAAEEKICN